MGKPHIGSCPLCINSAQVFIIYYCKWICRNSGFLKTVSLVLIPAASCRALGVCPASMEVLSRQREALPRQYPINDPLSKKVTARRTVACPRLAILSKTMPSFWWIRCIISINVVVIISFQQCFFKRVWSALKWYRCSPSGLDGIKSKKVPNAFLQNKLGFIYLSINKMLASCIAW